VNNPQTSQQDVSTPKACTAAIAAFTIWGLAALFWDLLSHVDAGKVFGQRVLWAFIILCLCLNKKVFILIRQLISQPKELLLSLASSACIGINWYVFIYAIEQNRVLEVSLGYFLNPLCNVLAGILFFGESSNKLQYSLFGLIFVAIATESIVTGSFGWIAVVLAVTFCAYGVTKKMRVTTGFSSLFIETALILPIVLSLGKVSLSDFSLPSSDLLLFILGGAITLAPLGLFSFGAKHLQLKTVGLIQYLAPTLQFMTGILYFQETVSTPRLISFSVVWFVIVVLLLEGRFFNKPKAH